VVRSLLVSTDWTRAFETDRLTDTERAMLMGDACAKAYGWLPKN
jgi:hypothetical protein